jgi:N-acyl-L-homoserine lactone synthetase
MGSVASSSYPRSTFSDHADSGRGFLARVAQLLTRTECRRADSSEEREAIFRLRYQAYLREGAIPPNSSGTFSDRYDETGNVHLFALYVDGELAASVRLHIASSERPECPTLEVFPDLLQPELDAGKILVDSTRFVADENLARLHRGLPYVTLRLTMLAAEYFGADHLLAAVREEHQAFYRRAFNHRLICGPRPYPLLAKPICLMTLNFPTAADDLYRRYPFFHSTVSERRRLFEHGPCLTPARQEPVLPPETVADGREVSTASAARR